MQRTQRRLLLVTPFGLPVITDLADVERRAQAVENENLDFRIWLKGSCNLNPAEIDKLVQQTTDEVWEKIDCTHCANCCRILPVSVDDEDIAKLASRLDLSILDFSERYVREREGEKQISSKPCVFLEGNLCSVYEDRPKVCRSYPYLHEQQFVHRLIGVLTHCEVCPIVFNTIQRIKIKLRWRARRG